MTDREQRGLVIAAVAKITEKGGVYLVPSQSGKGKYEVLPDPVTPVCTCPDYESRGERCAEEELAKIEKDRGSPLTQDERSLLFRTFSNRRQIDARHTAIAVRVVNQMRADGVL